MSNNFNFEDFMKNMPKGDFKSKSKDYKKEQEQEVFEPEKMEEEVP